MNVFVTIMVLLTLGFVLGMACVLWKIFKGHPVDISKLTIAQYRNLREHSPELLGFKPKD